MAADSIRRLSGFAERQPSVHDGSAGGASQRVRPSIRVPQVARRERTRALWQAGSRALRPRSRPGTSGWAGEWTVSRVLFRPAVTHESARIIHLGDALPRRSSTLTRRLATLRSRRTGHPRQPAYSSLLREGLATPPVTWLSRVGSYPTISPLPFRDTANRGRGLGRCDFCCAFPRVAPGRCYRLPCPAEPGLASRGRLPAGDPPATFGTPGGYPAGTGNKMTISQISVVLPT